MTVDPSKCSHKPNRQANHPAPSLHRLAVDVVRNVTITSAPFEVKDQTDHHQGVGPRPENHEA